MNEDGAGLDPEVISALAEALEDPLAALMFLHDFLSMLPGRMRRILHTLQDRDREPALDAIISLKTTAAMTGASAIHATSRNIELLIRAEHFHDAMVATEGLSEQVMTMVAATPRLMISTTKTLLTNGGRVMSHS